jgi:hypothetical protein
VIFLSAASGGAGSGVAWEVQAEQERRRERLERKRKHAGWAVVDEDEPAEEIATEEGAQRSAGVWQLPSQVAAQERIEIHRWQTSSRKRYASWEDLLVVGTARGPHGADAHRIDSHSTHDFRIDGAGCRARIDKSEATEGRGNLCARLLKLGSQSFWRLDLYGDNRSCDGKARGMRPRLSGLVVDLESEVKDGHR